MVQMWPHHNAETMGITIRYIKGYCRSFIASPNRHNMADRISLPDFVFNGERRPVAKAQKRSKTNRVRSQASLIAFRACQNDADLHGFFYLFLLSLLHVSSQTNGEAANGTPDPASADPPAKKIRSSPAEVPATMHSTSTNFVEELPTPIPLIPAASSLQSATSSSAQSPLPLSANGLLPTPMQNGRPMTPDGVPSLAELQTKTDLKAVPAAITS